MTAVTSDNGAGIIMSSAVTADTADCTQMEGVLIVYSISWWKNDSHVAHFVVTVVISTGFTGSSWNYITCFGNGLTNLSFSFLANGRVVITGA